VPQISGNNLISELTEKNGRRLLIVSFLVLVFKLYKVDLEGFTLFKLRFPPELFDVVALSLIIYFLYSLIVNWVGDLASFKLWFSSNDINSSFGTTMKTDASFLEGGLPLLKRLYEMESNDSWPDGYSSMNDDTKKEFKDFKTNLELYCVRLDGAGSRFNTLSKYGQFYIWIQSFILPMSVSLLALSVLICRGSFTLPT